MTIYRATVDGEKYVSDDSISWVKAPSPAAELVGWCQPIREAIALNTGFMPISEGVARAMANTVRVVRMPEWRTVTVAPKGRRELNRAAMAIFLASPPRRFLDGRGRKQGKDWDRLNVFLCNRLEDANARPDVEVLSVAGLAEEVEGL